MPGVTGAQTRWDDFVAIHATNNDPIHVSPILLGWHRQFNFEVERALREECGYQFGIPYLDFTRYQGVPPEQWPVFDGSPNSLSGNGVPTQDGCSCVTEGPLANWVIDLGPAGENGRCQPNPQQNGLGLNRHCLERRFDVEQLQFLSEQVVLGNILNNNDATSFMSAVERGPNFMHGSMHVFVGGTQDFTAFAPAEPIFLLLHAFLDLVYCVWQSLDPSTRFNDLAPPDVYNEIRQELQQGPPPQVNMQSPLPGFQQIRVIDTMSTTSGPYCYVYQ
ncbi:hypothetical protein PRZ48_009741 [Zasmidium cellare]|uniref:Tyrosinase copper-binding domain-containing protein n=1 Tax=Zasmidium cellare TaxID=395010 RepID=A0ABR0EDL9_ZASCE|nr:hypothetical protein PRZ48_009741 [Zasmidium cellare]